MKTRCLVFFCSKPLVLDLFNPISLLVSLHCIPGDALSWWDMLPCSMRVGGEERHGGMPYPPSVCVAEETGMF